MAGFRSRIQGLPVLGILVVATATTSIVEVGLSLVTRTTDTLVVGIGMFGLAGLFLLADRLGRVGRQAISRILAATGLLVIAFVLSHLFPSSISIAFVPILAFVIGLGGVRGRAVFVLALVAGLVSVAIVAAHQEPPPDEVRDLPAWFDAVVGVGLSAGVLMLTLWRQQREIGNLADRYVALVDDLPIGVFRIGPDATLLDANPAMARILGYESVDALKRAPADELYPPGLVDASTAELTSTGSSTGEVHVRRPNGGAAWVRYRGTAIWGDGGRIAAIEGVVEDVTADHAAREAAAQLASVVESATDAITSTTLSGIVTSWNAAAERLYGFTAAEIIGSSYQAIIPPSRRAEARETFDRIRAGQRIAPFETDRQRKEGSIVRVMLTVSPVHDDAGNLVGVSGVTRDLTEMRQLEDRLARWTTERMSVLDSLRRLGSSGSPAELAAQICREVSTTGGFDHAAVVLFGGDEARLIAGASRGRPALESPITISPERAAALIERAAGNPWIEDTTELNRSAARRPMLDLDIAELAYVPLEFEQRRIGVLAAGIVSTASVPLTDRVPVLEEFAAVCGALLGPGQGAQEAALVARARIQGIIDGRAFRSVFQPIVDLQSGATLGYESLTRFDDGTPPDRMFALARDCGLGLELERVTLASALDASRPLPANAFLDLNVSPDLVLARGDISPLLRESGWGVVLEITEHEQIEDYARMRSAIQELGPNVRLAIDDAGAGYASLRHILELRPEFVKLDRQLVAGIDRDTTRQALVAGMRYFAERTGCALVAEGIETEGERNALLALGIRQGQGYLLGRPAPASPGTVRAEADRRPAA